MKHLASFHIHNHNHYHNHIHIGGGGGYYGGYHPFYGGYHNNYYGGGYHHSFFGGIMSFLFHIFFLGLSIVLVIGLLVLWTVYKVSKRMFRRN